MNGKTKTARKRTTRKKSDFRFGTWNVLSLLRPGIQEDIWEVMKGANISIMALQETKIKGIGIDKRRRYTLLHSGNNNKEPIGGVAFLISNKIEDLILDYKGLNERICSIRIKGKFLNITLVNCYAPTEEKSEIEKEQFYNDLEKIVASIPKHDVKIILGDVNAKIGQEDCYFPTIGKYSLHETSNENGHLFVNFAIAQNLSIASTKFQHKNIHKGTWQSPDGSYVNQIDHVAISAKHGSYISDVRSYRSADCNSDHFLVGASLRIKLSSSYKSDHQKQNTNKFKLTELNNEETKANFISSIEKQLVDITDYGNCVNAAWERIEGVIKKSAKETLGFCKNKEKTTWKDQECVDMETKKKEARMKALNIPTRNNWNKYREIRNASSKLRRKKKRRFLNEIIEATEEMRENKDLRAYYKNIKNAKQGYQPRINQIKDKEGNILSGNNKVIKRWQEHFTDLFKSTHKINIPIPNPEAAQSTYRSNEIETPSEEEVQSAIQQLKNNKASGSDGIPTELLKQGGEVLHVHIYKTIKLIWEKEEMPTEWNTSVIVPVYKKGDKLNCNNHRGISLLNTAYKILSIIILNRLKPYANNLIGRYQAGFIPNKSTVDQIFSLRLMSEKLLEFGREMHILFIDFKQAFDSVSREKMLETIRELGIPGKYVNLIRMTTSNSVAKVQIGKTYSDKFKVEQGVKQGDSLSPLLFNLLIEKAVREIPTDAGGIQMNGKHQLFAFADDIAIVAYNKDGIESLLTAFETHAKTLGLVINEEKTKYATISRKNYNRGTHVKIGEHNFEVVSNFKYLGSTINSDNNLNEEIKSRISSGTRCFQSLKYLLRSKALSRRSKINIYKTIIRPTVTYGSETWTLNTAQELKLNCLERKILRAIFGPIQINNELWRIRTNSEINELYGEPDLVASIKKNRLRWLGHLERMDEEEPAKRIWKANMIGTRPKGRPRLRWFDSILKDLKNLKVNNWRKKAEDRAVWRKIVEAAGALKGP